MKKKYFYFQPQYVKQFKCDGSKCSAHCCRGWNIFIDKDTYKQYSKLGSQEITSHLQFNADKGEYLIRLGGKACPFLNENHLCRIQLEHGEKFLSQTCATYPRVTSAFGKFFERSLTLSCPVAAELILFNSKPMPFEFIEVPEKVHSPSGKVFLQSIQATDELRAHIIEIQVAMISILQERTLSIDQRLIVLDFFVDRLEEIFSDFNAAALTKLIAAYESKKFLAEQIPLMLQSISFDADKFVRLMSELLKKFADEETLPKDKEIIQTAAETLRPLPDKKSFLAEHSTFLENYLVNELILNIFPWRFEGRLMQNFAAFVAEYKLFELMIFSATLKGSDKKALIELVGWFTTRFDHAGDYRQMIFEHFNGMDDPFDLMESLLEAGD
ncbi:MAG: flagellin lysine-N-methylase [Quinella sp. 1Q5]|nr:flagellin lysine-N-methylase [Quinella sp. 1Q5]